MSGVVYGTSYHEPAYGGHVCRMSLDQWRACRQDVTSAGRASHSLWEVDFEFSGSYPENPSADVLDLREKRLWCPTCTRHKRASVRNGIDLCCDECSTIITSLGIDAKEGGSIPEAQTSEPLAGITNYRQLLSLAKKAGVENAENISTTAGLREAILAKQAA